MKTTIPRKATRVVGGLGIVVVMMMDNDDDGDDIGIASLYIVGTGCEVGDEPVY